jgi:predicted ATP-binding protein involved in virulence
MRITDLSLTHYRGAESLHLELDPNLNVFVGVNGSGKSTVLDAVAIMLSWAVNRIKSVGASGRPIAEADITNGFSSASIELICRDYDQDIAWRLAKTRKGHGLPEIHSDFNKLNNFTKQTQAKIADNNENVSLPIIIHYPVNRAVLDIPIKIRNKHSFNLLDIYSDSLISGVNFRIFFEWFREQEDQENEVRKYLTNPLEFLKLQKELIEQLIIAGHSLSVVLKGEGHSEDMLRMSNEWTDSIIRVLNTILDKESNYHSEFSKAIDISLESINHRMNILLEIKNSLKSEGESILFDSKSIIGTQLGVVRKALQTFLPEFANFRIRRSPLRMEVNKNNKIMTINQLSDGEKCLIALIGDLARRIAIANPTRNNPLEGNGIVIIDEIDLHLHPKWQRNIIPRLTEVFPNCQFIISTHSPHVINHVQPENIFLLDQTSEGIIASHPSKSYGNNADRILEDLMGLPTTRPDEVFQELRNIFSLIGSNSLSDAVEKIADLKKKIGTDPEIVKAEVLLARKEILGK